MAEYPRGGLKGVPIWPAVDTKIKALEDKERRGRMLAALAETEKDINAARCLPHAMTTAIDALLSDAQAHLASLRRYIEGPARQEMK